MTGDEWYREEFEFFVRQECPSVRLERRVNGYRSQVVNRWWKIWREEIATARAALSAQPKEA